MRLSNNGCLTFSSQSMSNLIQQRYDLIASLLQSRRHALNLGMSVVDIPFQPLVQTPKVCDDFALLLEAGQLA